MADGFISVYSKATGDKQRVPEHWLDVPSIAKQFNKTPRQRNRDRADEQTTNQASDTQATTANTETPATGDTKE